MSARILIALVALAIVAAIGALAGLALSDRGPDTIVNTRTETYVVERLATGPVSTPPPRPAAPAAEQAARETSPPVPALADKPARGPYFAIAHLLPGARVEMWAAPGHGFLGTLGPRTEFGSPVVFSVVKTRPGWLGVATPDLPNGRLGWIQRDPLQVEVYWTKYSLQADLSGLSLTLRYGAATIGRFLVTVGAPGSETPLGRYGVTDALSFEESPFYGCCALALSGRQTNLPADWIGGDRLAIHGTPGPVGGAESHGCIRATDETMRLLFERVPLGTPVFVNE